MKRLALLLVLSACPPAKEASEGPEILVRVFPSEGISFTNETLQPNVRMDAMTGNYELRIDVRADFGKTIQGIDTTYSPVSEVEGNVTPPGVDLTTADFMYDMTSDVLRQRDFTGTRMISIPAAHMGEMVTFTFSATDENGLSSNAVEFSALLD